MHIVKILDGRGGDPLEPGRPKAYEVNLDYHCNYLYSNDDFIEMIFADTVIINDYAFVLGQPKHSSKALHNGLAVYHMTGDKDDEAWHNCVQVAGDGLLTAGWVDGVRLDSCFSNTPCNMAVLPHSKAHVVVVANTDNCTLRYVDVTVPVELQDEDKASLVRALMVAYDEDSKQGNVPRTTNASKRCHFLIWKRQARGRKRDFLGWGGRGAAIMTNPSLLWQMSPEESTKDAKNWKNRCV